MNTRRIALFAWLAAAGCAHDDGMVTATHGDDDGGAGLGGDTGTGGSAVTVGTGGEAAAGEGGGGSGGTGGSGGEDAGGMGGGPTEQACPPGQFVANVDAQGTVICTTVDEAIRGAVNDECRTYAGWRDQTGALALEPPTKWGWASATSCAHGGGADNTCSYGTLGGSAVELFGLNPDDDVDHNDRIYLGLHCNAGTNASSIGPCAPGELVTQQSASGYTCTDARGAIVDYVRESCSVYFGWRDSCDGCTEPPTNWGKVSNTECAGSTDGDECVIATLELTPVKLVAPILDGDVNDDDKLYFGVHCAAPPAQSGPAMGACPAGQFATGTHADGSIECTSIAPAVEAYLAQNWFFYYGWRDSCDGCATLPDKWGSTRPDDCVNGSGTDNTCSTSVLDGQSVELFGLNPDGDVNGDDKFYFGMRCD